MRHLKTEYSHLPHGDQGNVPDTIVVHSMAQYLRDPEQIHARKFLDKYGWAAHALIEPSGKVWVLRDDDETAWHARGHNQNSLGIEFLVPGTHDYASFLEAIKKPFVTSDAWSSGVEVCRRWIEAYDIAQVVRHSDISPGRKVDPGTGFPWDYFMEEIYAEG